ncbi:MAG: bifunctional glutamate N-acetyltransferase/amino-acid acetyltransferase ArgJ [Solirubrobacterales bacterium]
MSILDSRWIELPGDAEQLDPARLALGFQASSAACGLKPGGATDLALLRCHADTVSSAVLLTRNAAAAAPVRVCREHLLRAGVRGLVANAGNANAATGDRGYEHAVRMQRSAAEAMELETSEVAVASTGVIGRPLEIDRIEQGIGQAAPALSADGGSRLAAAIMTTDDGPKACTVRSGGVTISAQAKGAGMIEPGFATLLAFVQTDAVVSDPPTALREAAAQSFERITVDGQMSTNDTLLLQATGAAGRPLPQGLLDTVLRALALAIVADGEGATRVARVRVSEAVDTAEAERVARAIANSQLVQTAIFGRDPNWGRIAQAAGQALAGEEDVLLDASTIDATELEGPEREVELAVRLGRGHAATHVWCSDLTYDYIKINAEYTT